MKAFKEWLTQLSARGRRDHRPFVEALPEVWTAQPAAGQGVRTEHATRTIHVPFADTELAANQRRLEMARASWGPEVPLATVAEERQVSYEALVHAEQMRLMHMLRYHAGLDLSAGIQPAAYVPAMAEEVQRVTHSDPLQALRMAMYHAAELEGTAQQEVWYAALEATTPVLAPVVRRVMQEATRFLLPPRHELRDPPWSSDEMRQFLELPSSEARHAFVTERVLRQARSGEIPFRRALAMAKFMDSFIAMMEDAAPAPGEEDDALGEEDAEVDGDDASLLEEMLDVLGVNKLRDAESAQWGRMFIEEPPRPVCHPQVRAARRRRSTDAGVALKHPHRLITDGRVFMTKRRLPGGTCLIDGSGSMSMRPEDVQQLLALAPQAVIAIYSGNPRDGVLRILARDGRQVDASLMGRPAGGYNVIDGPALRWLGKQAGPRLWVSDGGVTGQQDETSDRLTLECKLLRRKYRIQQLWSIDGAREVFLAQRRRLATR